MGYVHGALGTRRRHLAASPSRLVTLESEMRETVRVVTGRPRSTLSQRVGHWTSSTQWRHRVGQAPSRTCDRCGNQQRCPATLCLVCREEADTPKHVLPRYPALKRTHSTSRAPLLPARRMCEVTTPWGWGPHTGSSRVEWLRLVGRRSRSEGQRERQQQ